MADINIDDVTNTGGTGVFDKLMDSINGQIETQYLNNRITGTDYATVYLGSMQAALAQSIQFHMQDELTEAQVAGVLADNLVKAEQRLQIIKQVDVSERDMVEKEATGAKNRILLDEQKETSDAQQLILAEDLLIKSYENTTLQVDQHTTNIKQQTLLDTEEELKQFEATSMNPEKLLQIQEQVDLLQSQESELVLNGIKDRLLKDTQIAIGSQDVLVKEQNVLNAEQEVLNSIENVKLTIEKTESEDKQNTLDGILDKQLLDIVAGTTLKTSQNLDVITKTSIATAESSKNVLLKQEQIESEALNNGVDGVIANQILDIKKGVDVKERQMSEAEATGTKQRVLLDEEKETSDLQQIILGTEEEIKTAQLVETVDSTVRANTQLDDALVTSTEQRASMYTERVLKDKQAAKLGLDNVMKQSETSRDADPAFKYLPNYTGA